MLQQSIQQQKQWNTKQIILENNPQSFDKNKQNSLIQHLIFTLLLLLHTTPIKIPPQCRNQLRKLLGTTMLRVNDDAVIEFVFNGKAAVAAAS